MCILEAIAGEPPWGTLPDAAVAFRILKQSRLPLRPNVVNGSQWDLIGMVCDSDPTRRIKMLAVAERLAEFVRRNATMTVQEASVTSEDSGCFPLSSISYQLT